MLVDVTATCLALNLTDEEEKADTPEQQIVLTLRGYASVSSD